VQPLAWLLARLLARLWVGTRARGASEQPRRSQTKMPAGGAHAARQLLPRSVVAQQHLPPLLVRPCSLM